MDQRIARPIQARVGRSQALSIQVNYAPGCMLKPVGTKSRCGKTGLE